MGQPLRGLPGEGGGRLGPQGQTGSEAGSKGPNPGCTCHTSPDLREPQCPCLSNGNHISTHILKSAECPSVSCWGLRCVIEKKEVQEGSLGGSSKLLNIGAPPRPSNSDPLCAPKGSVNGSPTPCPRQRRAQQLRGGTHPGGPQPTGGRQRWSSHGPPTVLAHATARQISKTSCRARGSREATTCAPPSM